MTVVIVYSTNRKISEAAALGTLQGKGIPGCCEINFDQARVTATGNDDGLAARVRSAVQQIPGVTHVYWLDCVESGKE